MNNIFKAIGFTVLMITTSVSIPVPLEDAGSAGIINVFTQGIK